MSSREPSLFHLNWTWPFWPCLQGRRKSGALPSLVAVIETAASADSVDVSFIRRSIDLSRAGSTKSRPRQSLDISRAASGKSRTASGRLGRAGSSGPPKLPAKIDFGRIVEKEERSTGGVEVRMYKVISPYVRRNCTHLKRLQSRNSCILPFTSQPHCRESEVLADI